MRGLWNVGTEHNYHNLSVVFTNEYIKVCIDVLFDRFYCGCFPLTHSISIRVILLSCFGLRLVCLEILIVEYMSPYVALLY
jgi:hypothetical protein